MTGADFDGPCYSPVDKARLTGQILRVYNLIRDGKWRTLVEIAQATGDPESSVSAQLRHLRKEKFGAYDIEKRARGNRADGLYEYRLYTPRTDWEIREYRGEKYMYSPCDRYRISSIIKGEKYRLYKWRPEEKAYWHFLGEFKSAELAQARAG